MARQYQVLEPIKENITLSAANTYTEVEIALEVGDVGEKNRKGDKRKVMLIWGWELEPVSGDNYPFDAAGVTDGDSWDVQITTNSESAIVETIDKDLVLKYGEVINLLTSGLLLYEKVRAKWFPNPIPYVKKKIYLGAVSDGLTGTLDVNVTLWVSFGFISTYVLNRMIASKV